MTMLDIVTPFVLVVVLVLIILSDKFKYSRIIRC
jgi:hypothetical protein